MPIDSIVAAGLCDELNEKLQGSRVDKVHMPARDEVHILGRAPWGTYRLLVSGGTKAPRVHLTGVGRENPPAPPMFCMLLRKHLVGGRFISAAGKPMERMITLTWDALDEMGVPGQKRLICEMMGRNANVVLVDADGRIVDCLRRSDLGERPVLPGLFYREPPSIDKQNPLELSREAWREMFAVKPAGLGLDQWLMDHFGGLSPFFCRDIEGANDPEDAFFSQMERLRQGELAPYSLTNDKGKRELWALPLCTAEPLWSAERYEGGFNALLDEVYTRTEREGELASKVTAVAKSAKNQRDKLRKKEGAQLMELEAAKDREALREMGDLLMANLHRAERGMAALMVEDFYHENQPRSIPLDETRNAQQNAARYYKRYSKAKTAETELTKQLVLTRRDIAYWDSVLEQLDRVHNEAELQEIREELNPGRLPKGKKPKLSKPMAFRSSTGVVFYAGRNNRQNDELTFKLSGRGDTWLHTQKIPGAHVVISGAGEVDETTLYEAAAVAAYFSGAKTSPKVPVDYTRLKYVKKPSGAKPGMVIYDHFKSVLVEPDGEMVQKLTADSGR